MVSVEHYLNTFESAMPARALTLKSIWEKKAQLELKLKNKDFGTKSDIQVLEELRILIGKDSIFRKSEDNTQSLRYYTHKSINSLKLLGENLVVYKNRTNQQIIDELEKNKITFIQLVESITSISSNTPLLMQKIDDALQYEYNCLNNIISKITSTNSVDSRVQIASEITTYFELVNEEKDCMKTLVESLPKFVKEINTFNKSIQKYIYNKDIKNRWDTLGVISYALIVGLGVAFAVSFCIHSKDSGWINLKPDTTTTAIGLMTTITMISRAIIIRLIPSEASKNLEPLMKQIGSFVE